MEHCFKIKFDHYLFMMVDLAMKTKFRANRSPNIDGYSDLCPVLHPGELQETKS